LVRFFDIFRPFIRIMPEVKAPDRKVPFKEKLIWTTLVLVLFLIMSNMPLWGIPAGQQGFDYLYYMRLILASSRGTLMELGIGPVVTAGLVMQLLVGSQIVKIDYANPEDRALFTGSQKVLAVFITIFQAAAFVLSNSYGTLEPPNALAVFLQLFAGGILVLLMDEMLQKGWGIGSGVSLFIAANVSTTIMWGAFSVMGTSTENGDGYYRGAIIAFFQMLYDGYTNNDIWGYLQKAFYRPHGLPDMTGVLATIAVFLMVVYVESVRVELPVVHSKYRGFRGKYPIKLMYTSNIPIILVQALYANVLFFSQILWTRDPNNFWFGLLGTYKTAEEGGRLEPIGGLVYYLTPPRGLDLVYQDPIRAIIYGILLIGLSGMFASMWVEVAGLTPRDVARQLISADVRIPGFRNSQQILTRILEKYIPTVALFGGFLMGALAAFADYLGALGTGAGVLLTVGIIYQYYQLLAQEQLAEMHPALRGILGLE